MNKPALRRNSRSIRPHNSCGFAVMKESSTKNLTISGLFLALALLMPFLTAQIPSIGSRLLPMHIPVLLCGLICGWPYGLAVGLTAPVLRSLLFAMPPMVPTAVAMSFELAAYGLVAGYFYKLLPKKASSVYLALVPAMLIGRVVWGLASLLIFNFIGKAFTWKFFMTYAFLNAIPGIVLQIVIIPIILIALNRANLVKRA